MINYISKVKQRNPHIRRISLFVLIWLATSFIFFVRSPDNYLAPNFYAEDGIDYMTDILNVGPINAIGIPFNGYFVAGLYLIGDVALLINKLIFSGEYIELPRSIALA